jgi:periplasmic protein TonB
LAWILPDPQITSHADNSTEGFHLSQIVALDKPVSSWAPEELGFTRSTIAAVALVALIGGISYWAAVTLVPKPLPAPIQVTQAQLAALPPPPPPPKPLIHQKPPVITKPPPVQSRITIAVKTPPHPIVPPVHHIVIQHPSQVSHPAQPPAPIAPAAPKSPTAPPSPSANGIPAYGSEVHDIIQANQSVPPALAELGISGTAVIQLVISPSGQVISAKILQSSGNAVIDQVALDHAEHAHFDPFTPDMPDQPWTFTVPVNIQPQND